MKYLFSFTLILFTIVSFSQEKLVEKVTINGKEYKVIETISEEDNTKQMFQVQEVFNDVVIAKVDVIKAYKNDMEDYNATFELIDSVFVFNGVLKRGDETFYGINRVFINPNGYLFKGLEYDSFTKSVPDKNSYPAQFDGGLSKLRKWVQYRVDAQKLLRLSSHKSLRLMLDIDIDENGKAILKNVSGSDIPAVKTEMKNLILSMPTWIPAKENGKIVVSKFKIPIDVIDTE